MRSSFFLGILLILSLIAEAQDELRIRITDEKGVPLPFAALDFQPGNHLILADGNGFVVFKDHGHFTSVSISKLGFRPLEMSSQEFLRFPVATLASLPNDTALFLEKYPSEKDWLKIIEEALEIKRQEEFTDTVDASVDVKVKEGLTLKGFYDGVVQAILSSSVGIKSMDVNIQKEELLFTNDAGKLNNPFAFLENTPLFEEGPDPLKHAGNASKRDLKKDFKIEVLAFYNTADGETVRFRISPLTGAAEAKTEMVIHLPDYQIQVFGVQAGSKDGEVTEYHYASPKRDQLKYLIYRHPGKEGQFTIETAVVFHKE